MLPTLDQTCSAQCRDLDRKDYTHLLWTTLAEFPGILLTIVTIEKLGRKKTMALEFILLTIALCFLFNCSSNRFLLTIILFFVRGLASGVFQVNKSRSLLQRQKWIVNYYVKKVRQRISVMKINTGVFAVFNKT